MALGRTNPLTLFSIRSKLSKKVQGIGRLRFIFFKPQPHGGRPEEHNQREIIVVACVGKEGRRTEHLQ